MQWRRKGLNFGLGLLAIALYAAIPPVAAGQKPPASTTSRTRVEGPEIKPGRVLIGVDETTSESDLRGLASAVHSTVLRSHPKFRVHVLSVPVGTEWAAVAALKARPHVRYAEPNFVRHLDDIPAPNDPQFVNQWNLPKIQAPSAWNLFPNCLSCQAAGANGPLVAIVDSGIDLTNADLADGRATGDPDVYGHGTHVAGIIAAAANNGYGVVGLAYNVRLASYRACDSSGNCATDDVVNSIDAAVSVRAKVINLSLGGKDHSDSECAAIETAVGMGSNVVASSGNNGVIGVNWPAGCAYTIIAASSDINDQIAPTSNGSAGGNFMVAAPGVSILSTLPTNPNLRLNSPTGFGYMSGTSMAAPHVTALVALLLGMAPNLTWKDIQLLLAENSDKVGGAYGADPGQFQGNICPPGACTWNNRFGYGRINVARTLCAAAGNPPIVQKLNPNFGPVGGGTPVTITGACFFNVQGIGFGIAPAPRSFAVNSPSQISAVSPPSDIGGQNVGGSVHVTVSALGGGTSTQTTGDLFNYGAVGNISPASGPMQGGTTVTITGQGFNATVLHGTQAYFGSTPSPNVYCSSSTSCVAASPPHNPGQVPVTVSVNGVRSQIGNFTYQLPTISSISPSIGPETGGTSIDIHGVSFAQSMSLSFRNTQSGQSTPVPYVVCQDNTWCTIKTPPGTGTAEINATVTGFTSIPNPPYDVFTYQPFPVVSSLTPADGPATGGTPVSVSGTNFSFAPTIQFGANPATNVRCSRFMGANLWTCQTKSPAGSRKVDVTVSVNGMTSLTGPADQFTYIPVVSNASPVTGPQNGGTKVSITGAGFTPTQHAGDTAVSFGANSVSPALVSCSSLTSCVVTSPAAKLPRVGGVDIEVTVDGQTSAVNRPEDLFTYTPANLSGWTQWYPSTSPPGGVTRNLIYDATRSVMLYFGSSTVRNPIAQTWTWDGGSWSQLTPLTNPNGRPGAFAFDAASGTAVLFGGFDPNTWLWDGSNWNSVLPSTHPSPRRGASMTYDPTNKVIVLFGGCANQTCSTLLNDTWTWNGSNWTQQNPSASPPPRSGAYLAYDSATGTAVLFGGMSSSARLNDTWVWNGSTWIQLHPATSPSPREGTGMTYDPVLGGLVLFGGTTSNGSVSDLWTWNGSTWSQLAMSGPHPDGGSGVVMDYDASLNAVVLLGLDGSTWTWQR